jgi:hypothetical protein
VAEKIWFLFLVRPFSLSKRFLFEAELINQLGPGGVVSSPPAEFGVVRSNPAGLLDGSF